MENVTLLPADRYVIFNKTILTDFDKKVLITFYEPIIGHLGVSLYLTLWNDLEGINQISRELNHHHLMSILKCPLNAIKEAREALEAVGLIKTYFKSGDINNYIYELYSPLSPTEFLNHPILNVVLYDNIGDSEYEYLKKLYQKLKIDTKDYTDVSKKIDEVYVSQSDIPVFESIERSVNDISCNDQVDFDLIISSIPKGIINERAFNKKTKELINQLAFIYKIDSLKMMELIRSVLNEYGMIDKTALRQASRKMYQFNNGALPTLIYRSQPEYLKTPVGDNSMRGKIIRAFESINPVDFLRNKYRGVKPTTADIKIIEMLVIDLEMPPAVVNVLLDYVLRKNNNRLSRAYIETIAGQWKRAGLKNASEAMDFAEKENNKLTKKLSNKEHTSNEPVWFNKDNQKQELTVEEQQEMENLFKEFK
ncbi:MAG TPA: DnaD domain protein [Candidatus Onthocola stercoravium]|nr:DnaD domain protein [Candidatus Onthocola stercoravium]